MQPSTEPVCVVIKRGEPTPREPPGKQDLDYFTGVSAETAGSKRLCMHLVAIPPRGRAKPAKGSAPRYSLASRTNPARTGFPSMKFRIFSNSRACRTKWS